MHIKLHRTTTFSFTPKLYYRSSTLERISSREGQHGGVLKSFHQHKMHLG